MSVTNKAMALGLMMTIALLAFLAGLSIGQERKADSRVYELRTYTTAPGRLPALQKLFAEHTMRLFEKHGIRNGMQWIPTDEARKENTFIYFVVHESRDAAERNWKAFSADPEWVQARSASQAEGKIVENAERVFMRSADFSPR